MKVMEKERSTWEQQYFFLAWKNNAWASCGKDVMENKQVREILKGILMVILARKRLLSVPRWQKEKYYIQQITLKL